MFPWLKIATVANLKFDQVKTYDRDTINLNEHRGHCVLADNATWTSDEMLMIYKYSLQLYSDVMSRVIYQKQPYGISNVIATPWNEVDRRESESRGS